MCDAEFGVEWTFGGFRIEPNCEEGFMERVFVRKRGKEISQKILLCPRVDAAFIPRFGLYLNSGPQCMKFSGMAKVKMIMMMMIDE